LIAGGTRVKEADSCRAINEDVRSKLPGMCSCLHGLRQGGVFRTQHGIRVPGGIRVPRTGACVCICARIQQHRGDGISRAVPVAYCLPAAIANSDAETDLGSDHGFLYRNCIKLNEHRIGVTLAVGRRCEKAWYKHQDDGTD